MNELITIPKQPSERCKFKRRQQVYFVGSNILRPCSAVVVEHYDWKDAVKIEDGRGIRIVTVNELFSLEEYDKLKAGFLQNRLDNSRQKQREKLLPVIQMWQAGIRTAKGMMEKSGADEWIGFVSQIRAAKRAGFI